MGDTQLSSMSSYLVSEFSAKEKKEHCFRYSQYISLHHYIIAKQFHMTTSCFLCQPCILFTLGNFLILPCRSGPVLNISDMDLVTLFGNYKQFTYISLTAVFVVVFTQTFTRKVFITLYSIVYNTHLLQNLLKHQIFSPTHLNTILCTNSAAASLYSNHYACRTELNPNIPGFNYAGAGGEAGLNSWEVRLLFRAKLKTRWLAFIHIICSCCFRIAQQLRPFGTRDAALEPSTFIKSWLCPSLK